MEFIPCHEGFEALCFDWLIWNLEIFPFAWPVLACFAEVQPWFAKRFLASEGTVGSGQSVNTFVSRTWGFMFP